MRIGYPNCKLCGAWEKNPARKCWKCRSDKRKARRIRTNNAKLFELLGGHARIEQEKADRAAGIKYTLVSYDEYKRLEKIVQRSGE